MSQLRGWDRMLWGVAFRDPNRKRHDGHFLVGTAWDRAPRSTPATEPTRPLLFCTRRAARAWCKAQQGNHYAKSIRVVRVRETVEPTPPPEPRP